MSSESRSKKTTEAGVWLGEQPDAGRSGMNAELESVEIEAAVLRDDEFAVEDAAGGELGAERDREGRGSSG